MFFKKKQNIPQFLKNQHCMYIYIYIYDVIQQGTEQCQQIQTNKNYTKNDNQKINQKIHTKSNIRRIIKTTGRRRITKIRQTINIYNIIYMYMFL